MKRPVIATREEMTSVAKTFEANEEWHISSETVMLKKRGMR